MDATAPTQSQEEGAAQPPESQASDASSTAPDALDRDQQNGSGSTTHQGNGVPPSPTAGRASTPQTGPAPVATPSAGSASGSDSAGQLVDTLHIVATDRNAVDKYDLYELFSVQDGFQRIAWQNEGQPFCFVVLRIHKPPCLSLASPALICSILFRLFICQVPKPRARHCVPALDEASTRGWNTRQTQLHQDYRGQDELRAQLQSPHARRLL